MKKPITQSNDIVKSMLFKYNSTKKSISKRSFMTQNIIIANDNNIQEHVLYNKQPVILYFSAPWCGPCKMLGPMLEKLAADFNPSLVLVKVNVDESPQSPEYFNANSIPTVMFIKNGHIEQRFSGIRPEPELRSLIRNFIQ